MQKRRTLFAHLLLLCALTTYAQTANIPGHVGLTIIPAKMTGMQPPKLHQPTYLPEDGGLYFSWEGLQLPAGCVVEYEVRIFSMADGEQLWQTLQGEAFYSTATPEAAFRYGNDLPPLRPGRQYAVTVNTRLQYDDRTEVLDGSANELVFTHIPECTPPAKVKVDGIGTDNFTVSWSGVPASKEGYRYVVRYKDQLSKHANWKEVLVRQGNSVEIYGLDHQVTYEVEVQKICPPAEDYPELTSEWAGQKDIVLPSQKSITLPPFACGDPFTAPGCNGYPVRTGSFDTLYIGGFPVEVDSIWTVPDENWWGYGYAPLPFGDALVKVEWQQIEIDSNGYVCSGEIRGVSDDSIYWPDLNPGPIPFGGEICVPLPSTPGFDTSGTHSVTGLPWDENGFGPDSTYVKVPPYEGYEPGDLIDTTGTYDPWGFDANGIHIETGTTTNPYGCTQEQLNSQPQPSPCDSLPPPYYWLDPGGNAPTQEGNELANDVADSLATWISQILENLEEQYQDTVDVKRLSCNGIRSSMNTIMAALGYEEKYIFGENAEYFDEGMHERFTSEPEPLAINIERDPNQEQLEEKHIDLYHCDKDLHVFIHLVEILEDLRTNQLNSLINDIKEKIENLTAEQANLFSSNQDSLYNWLEVQLKLISNQEYYDLYGFQNAQNDDDNSRWAASTEAGLDLRTPLKDTQSFTGFGNYLASNVSDDELNEVLLQSLHFTPQDAQFQFRQGWKMINGVHRAYYLETIENERTKANFLNPLLLTAHDSTLMLIIVDNRASDGRLHRVYLDDIVFYTTHATLDAYILLELPNNGQKIVFEADDIHFGPTGPQAFPMKLSLNTDIDIRLSNAAKLVIKGTQNTFVSVDCQGFAGVGVEAEVEICRDYVIPIDPATGELLPDPERVHGYIQTFFPTWNDFYVEISMDPFAVKGVEDIKWHIDQVVVDFSDFKSPDSLAAPPPGYSSPFAGPGGFLPCWKGFYMRNFSASLPKQLSENGSLTVGVEHVVIDDLGFSGHIYAANILPLSEGNAGGWAFSIDTIGITIIANQLQDAGMNGLIHVPLISSANDCNTGPATAADCLQYDAFIEPGNIYHFDVLMPEEDYCIDMWKAGTVVLHDNTTITMKLENGEFDMLATMFGEVKINGNLTSGLSINIPNIRFEQVEISNKDPYFSPGKWKFPTSLGADFGGFGLTISDIKMIKTDEGYPALKFGAQIRIVNDEIPLSAGGGFKIVGEKVEYNDRQRWKFKEFKVEKIFIDGSFAGVSRIQGLLEFFDQDTTYGTGFRGGVGVAFEGLNASVTAIGHFGKMDTYKYFFVDALACVTIPIAPGVDLTGFGGGVYYNMDRVQPTFSLPACIGTPTIPSTPGMSLSGITYLPVGNNSLGLKATVAMAVAKESALNANATFEIKCKPTLDPPGFGIERIDFYGNARLLAVPDKHASPEPSANNSTPPSTNGATVNANIRLELNFQNRTLSGEMVTFLNTPGNFLTGSGPNGRLNQTEIYFGPDKWYVRMGRPSLRNGMVMQIPGINQPIAQIGSYFQIGNGGIDPMPEIPGEIQDQLGLSGGFPSINNRGTLINNGGGFTFGAQVNVDFEAGFDVKGFSVVSAQAHGIVGFDVAVLDWGESAVCAGSGQQVGINGWYAQGQIYGGFTASLEVLEIELANVGFAGALEARFPNPFWARGRFSARISNPMGWVPFSPDEFKVKLNVELGEKCEITGIDNPIVEVPIIERIVPANGMVGVSVEANPEITFLMPMGESFGIPELGESYSYTPVLDHANLLYKGIIIPVETSWNEDMTQLKMIPNYFLPSNDTLVLDVLVHVDSNGISIHSEHRIDTFFTVGMVPKILEENVAGSYPFDGQYNFYKKEIPNKKGYILLKKGQPELFYEMEGYHDLRVKWERGSDNKTVFLQDVS